MASIELESSDAPGKMTPSEYATFVAYHKAFCEHFATMAPKAMADLLKLSPELQRIQSLALEGETDTARDLIHGAFIQEIDAWVERWHLTEPWAHTTAASTLLIHASSSLRGGVPPTTLMPASITMRDTEQSILHRPLAYSAHVRFEMPAFEIDWDPIQETPGEMRERATKAFTAQLATMMEHDSAVFIDDRYIDWTIQTRVMGTSVNSIATSLGIQTNNVRYGIKSVERILFKLTPKYPVKTK